MAEEEIRSRLQAAAARGQEKVTEDELAAVTATVLEMIIEVTNEFAAVLADFELRLEALEES